VTAVTIMHASHLPLKVWFTADAGAQAVTVLAVFLAGEDRHRKMASRLRRTRA